MRIAFIARADNSGLGSLSWEFARHIKPDKILIVDNGIYALFPERFADFNVRITGRQIKREDIIWLLNEIDLLIMVETPYDRSIPTIAKQKGVKRLLIPMYESLPNNLRPNEYDFFLCPSLLDLRYCPEPKKFLPFPVNREVIHFKPRNQAMVFLHNAGHGGMASRNGTDELLQAIPLVANQNISFIINSQTKLYSDDPRVAINVGNVRDYWELWREGDVFVFPEKFNGLSLPINEALAAGMVVMSSDRFPFNQWLPTDPLIPVKNTMRALVSTQMVDYAIIKPEDVAAKIDEYAEQDISRLSEHSNALAEQISWERLLPEYLKVFENLCQN